MGTSAQIVELAQRSGIGNTPGSRHRPGAVTDSGKRSHHADDNAVDFMGYSQDALAKFFLAIPHAEVFHYSDATKTWYGSSRGKPVDAATHRALVESHRNHLHVAIVPGQIGNIMDMVRKGLAGVGGGIVAGLSPIGNLIPNPANVTEALTNVGQGMFSLAQSAANVGEFAGLATRLFLPTNQIRVAAAFFGTIFVLIGIWFLAREVRESTP